MKFQTEKQLLLEILLKEEKNTLDNYKNELILLMDSGDIEGYNVYYSLYKESKAHIESLENILRSISNEYSTRERFVNIIDGTVTKKFNSQTLTYV